MNSIRNIRRKLTSAAAAVAVSAIFITAAAAPVSIPADGFVATQTAA